MGYDVQAVVAGDEVLRIASRELPGSAVVRLGQGLSMMPMTDELFDAVTDGSGAGDLGFWRLPGGFEALLARWSAAGPIAYLEAEHFEGVGRQRAAVWADGSLALGPLDEPTKQRGSQAVSPAPPGPAAARRTKGRGQGRVRVRGAEPPPHQRGLDRRRLLGQGIDAAPHMPGRPGSPTSKAT